MNLFDDLTRDIASGTSRRDVLRRLGGGLAGLLLASLGVKKASAAVSCGVCQVCDLDTNMCGLPCSSPSAGSALCTQASTDGSYIRLVNYLTTNGFVSAGVSDPVLVNQSGLLVGSGLLSNFTSSGTLGTTAVIQYMVGPNGDISVLAAVSQNGSLIYTLNIDYNGRAVQTIVPQQVTSAPSSDVRASRALSGTGHVLAPRTPHPDISSTPHPDIFGLSPTQCQGPYLEICENWVGASLCWIGGAVACAKFLGITWPAAVCNQLVGRACSYLTTSACMAEETFVCGCSNGGAYCDGTCCATCEDCFDDLTCVPNGTCADVCCNNVCCDPGLICSDNVCSSPSSQCDGATCGNFIGGCNGNAECFCWTIAEGGGVCGGDGSTPCDTLSTCSSSADCPSDWVCAVATCCGYPVCLPVCSLTSSSSSADLRALRNEATTSGRPTPSHR